MEKRWQGGSQPTGGAGLLAGVLPIGEESDEADVLGRVVARFHQDDVLPATLPACLQMHFKAERGEERWNEVNSTDKFSGESGTLTAQEGGSPGPNQREREVRRAHYS